MTGQRAPASVPRAAPPGSTTPGGPYARDPSTSTPSRPDARSSVSTGSPTSTSGSTSRSGSSSRAAASIAARRMLAASARSARGGEGARRAANRAASAGSGERRSTVRTSNGAPAARASAAAARSARRESVVGRRPTPTVPSGRSPWPRGTTATALAAPCRTRSAVPPTRTRPWAASWAEPSTVRIGRLGGDQPLQPGRGRGGMLDVRAGERDVRVQVGLRVGEPARGTNPHQAHTRVEQRRDRTRERHRGPVLVTGRQHDTPHRMSR